MSATKEKSESLSKKRKRLLEKRENVLTVVWQELMEAQAKGETTVKISGMRRLIDYCGEFFPGTVYERVYSLLEWGSRHPGYTVTFEQLSRETNDCQGNVTREMLDQFQRNGFLKVVDRVRKPDTDEIQVVYEINKGVPGDYNSFREQYLVKPDNKKRRKKTAKKNKDFYPGRPHKYFDPNLQKPTPTQLKILAYAYGRLKGDFNYLLVDRFDISDYRELSRSQAEEVINFIYPNEKPCQTNDN